MSQQAEIYRELIAELRSRARSRIEDPGTTIPTQTEQSDDAELFKALARMVEGKSVYEAFGAPGGWGYGTPFGIALKAAYSRPGSNPTRAVVG